MRIQSRMKEKNQLKHIIAQRNCFGKCDEDQWRGLSVCLIAGQKPWDEAHFKEQSAVNRKHLKDTKALDGIIEPIINASHCNYTRRIIGMGKDYIPHSGYVHLCLQCNFGSFLYLLCSLLHAVSLWKLGAFAFLPATAFSHLTFMDFFSSNVDEIPMFLFPYLIVPRLAAFQCSCSKLLFLSL